MSEVELLTKLCRGCNVEKSESEFYRRGSGIDPYVLEEGARYLWNQK